MSLRVAVQFKALVSVRQLVKMSEWCSAAVAVARQHLAACAICGFGPRVSVVTLLGSWGGGETAPGELPPALEKAE